MKRTFLNIKLHGAKVTQANLEYEGSISIDKDILKETGLMPFEKVDIYNINNGERFSTYIIPGEKGEIALNGAAARKVQVGDRIIIVSYVELEENEIKKHTPKCFILDSNNKIVKKFIYKISFNGE
ncbi:MAG TPA: aspartate 1-decarboxylase [Desulfurobacteriaceae bacterium]|nr:aspartate 1-decarboxylase [Desulfurobacteriaceae bacterium]